MSFGSSETLRIQHMAAVFKIRAYRPERVQLFTPCTKARWCHARNNLDIEALDQPTGGSWPVVTCPILPINNTTRDDMPVHSHALAAAAPLPRS